LEYLDECTSREETRLEVLQNRMLSRILRPEKEEVTRETIN
jgi:hypothetical protein